MKNFVTNSFLNFILSMWIPRNLINTDHNMTVEDINYLIFIFCSFGFKLMFVCTPNVSFVSQTGK